MVHGSYKIFLGGRPGVVILQKNPGVFSLKTTPGRPRKKIFRPFGKDGRLMGHISDRETRSIINLRLGSKTRNMVSNSVADPIQEALSETVLRILFCFIRFRIW